MIRAPQRSGLLEPIPVLLYHAVTDMPPPDQPDFAVAPALFAEHVAAMVASGLTALSASELGQVLRGERSRPGRTFGVTFDDGFDNTVQATRALSEQGIVSTVFITTGRMSGERPDLAPSTVDALAANELVELGAHTVSHPYLDEISLPAARQEIADSRRSLEQRTMREVSSFAYPFGAYTRAVRDAAASAGFRTAAAVKNAFSHRHDDPLAFARVTVMSDTSAEALAALLDGRGAPLAWARERYRTRAYRSFRRLRRHALELRRDVRSP